MSVVGHICLFGPCPPPGPRLLLLYPAGLAFLFGEPTGPLRAFALVGPSAWAVLLPRLCLAAPSQRSGSCSQCQGHVLGEAPPDQVRHPLPTSKQLSHILQCYFTHCTCCWQILSGARLPLCVSVFLIGMRARAEQALVCLSAVVSLSPAHSVCSDFLLCKQMSE